jgi:hypothetical protein
MFDTSPGVRLPALWSGFKCAGHRTGSEIVTEACRGRCAGYATGDGVAGVPAFGAVATTALTYYFHHALRPNLIGCK